MASSCFFFCCSFYFDEMAVTKQHIQGETKQEASDFCQRLCQILTDFQNSSTGTFRVELAIMRLLNIPPHLNRVAALPCKIKISKITNHNQYIRKYASSETSF